MSSSPRLRILSVGGNAVSAFLSWRLQATNACDVTLVWKSGFEAVSQYGISFRSKLYGNERFKPRAVVRSPEEAAGPPGFDYVLLCVKALPDVYDLAAVIESVVTPQLTCIIVNTTNSIGVEPYLESRFPTNVVLSLCSGANIAQLGPSEFEHVDFSEVWVGSANPNPNIATTVQGDMAEALSLTLQSGNVQCYVSPNIRQQQWDKMIGPIAFHPLSVLTDTANHSALLDKIGMRSLIHNLIDELILIAKSQGCHFETDFEQQTIDSMQQVGLPQSTMYQDFIARRPMEVEIFLGSASKMAQEAGISCPHIQTLYPLLSSLNIANQARPPTPPIASVSPPRQSQPTGGPQSQAHASRVTTQGFSQPTNGRTVPGNRVGGPGPSNGRRLPINNGSRGPSSGQGQRSNQNPNYGNPSRRNSFDNDLEEFGHIAMYGDMLHTDDTDDMVLANVDERLQANSHIHSMGRMHPENLAIRERELILKQKELHLREKELVLQQNGKGGRRKNNTRNMYDDDDDDDDDDYFSSPGPQNPQIDPDNIDMMSVTSRRNRRLPSASSLRNTSDRPVLVNRNSYGPNVQTKNRNRDRTSSKLINDFPALHASITDDPLMAYSSNRYGGVDRKALADNSRANSLTAQRVEDSRGDSGFGGIPSNGGPYPPPTNRRTSFNPGDNRNSGHLNGNRSSFVPANQAPQPNGRLNIPHPTGTLIRQPQPKYPAGHVIPQVEQQAQNGVSHVHLQDSNDAVRSLTGSASASADSGDSGTVANLAFAKNDYSSASSLEMKPAHGVRMSVQV